MHTHIKCDAKAINWRVCRVANTIMLTAIFIYLFKCEQNIVEYVFLFSFFFFSILSIWLSCCRRSVSVHISRGNILQRQYEIQNVCVHRMGWVWLFFPFIYTCISNLYALSVPVTFLSMVCHKCLFVSRALFLSRIYIGSHFQQTRAPYVSPH